jgi:hypothetical protein
MWPQLSLVVSSFSLDQYLYDLSDHGRSDYTPWYTDIFRLILRLVLLGLVREYDSLWSVTTFLFSYSWPKTVVWYIFTWIYSVIQIGSHVCKVSTKCNEQLVLPAGSPSLHFWVFIMDFGHHSYSYDLTH